MSFFPTTEGKWNGLFCIIILYMRMQVSISSEERGATAVATSIFSRRLYVFHFDSCLSLLTTVNVKPHVAVPKQTPAKWCATPQHCIFRA